MAPPAGRLGRTGGRDLARPLPDPTLATRRRPLRPWGIPARRRVRRDAIGAFRQEHVRFEGLNPGGETLSFWNVKYLLADPYHGATAERARQELGLEVVEVYRGVDGVVLLNLANRPRLRLEGGGEARLLGRTATRWEIATSSARPGRLTVANPFFPGWEVLLDGAPVALHLEPGDPLELTVPAGEHRVVVRYRPWSLRLGVALAVLGVLLLLGPAAAGRARRSNSSPRSSAQRGLAL